MNLEFIVYELKGTSRIYDLLFKNVNRPNEFIVVGDESGMLKVQQVEERGLCLIPGIPLDEFCLCVPEDDLVLKNCQGGVEIREFDIPKEYLSFEIVENIQRLNKV